MHRFLETAVIDGPYKSVDCKITCIDKGLQYCAAPDFSHGNCCQMDETCTIEGGFCTSNNPNAPLSFHYLMCPVSQKCGDKQMDVVKGVHTEFSKMTRTNSDSLEFGDLCSYEISSRNEPTLNYNERLWVSITNIRNAQVWVSQTKSSTTLVNEQRDLQVNSTRKFSIPVD